MSVSLCVLRLEIDEEMPNSSEKSKDVEKEKKDRGARESKTITVETYASKVGGVGKHDQGLLPTSSRQHSRSMSSGCDNNDETISFFCGNPLIEVTKGVIHLYKENELKEVSNATVLCLLAVPASLGARDLLAFAAACQQDIAHVRVLRDGSPSHYMALLTFRSPQAAKEFHSAFDGVPYSSLEPALLCHVAWVSRVEWGRDGTPPSQHTELPTCPVCLERMDESVAGVLSVQCAHAFHADCLLRWGDASCPVCRCTQTPEPTDRAQCFECLQRQQGTEEEANEESRMNLSGVTEGLMDDVDTSALWICLICGHVGCGRYENGHAAKHFLASNHTYALQMGSNRVWDYAGDNFVHRLVQNKGDGKLVAAEGGGVTNDKMEAAQIEFTHLLTQQLERQRHYYEEKIEKLDEQHKAECSGLKSRAEKAESEVKRLKESESNLMKDNKHLHSKLQSVTQKLSSIQAELSEEKNLTAALSSNQSAWQTQSKAREEQLQSEVDSLKEQVRDVMLYLDAQSKLQNAGVEADELATASVTVQKGTNKKGRRKKQN